VRAGAAMASATFLRWIMELRRWHAQHRQAVGATLSAFVAADIAGSFHFVFAMLRQRLEEWEAEVREETERQARQRVPRVLQLVLQRCEREDAGVWPLSTAEFERRAAAAGPRRPAGAAIEELRPAGAANEELLLEWADWELVVGWRPRQARRGEGGGEAPAPREALGERRARSRPVPFWAALGKQVHEWGSEGFAAYKERVTVTRLSALRFRVVVSPAPGPCGPRSPERDRYYSGLETYIVDYLS